MKRGAIWLLVAALAGVAAFFFMRWQSRTVAATHGNVGMPGLAWLRTELQLSETQFAMVAALHETYRPRCEAMCERITASHEKIEALARGAKELTPEYREALKAHADVHLECQTAMLGHLYETARMMDTEQATEYLKLVVPYAVDLSHSERSCPYCRPNHTAPDGAH